MNIACLLLAFALSLSRCGAQQLRIGAPVLGQLTKNDRGDVEHRILGADYQNQFMMIIHPSVTGLKAANYYLQHIITFIERSTTEFKIRVGDLTASTGMLRRGQLGRRGQRLDGRC